MGMYDTVIIDREELPKLEILNQLGLSLDDIDFQTKDLECILETYTFKRYNEPGVLVLKDSNDEIYGVTKAIHIYENISTKDDIEQYWIEFIILIKRGIVESISLANLYKMGNKKFIKDLKGVYTIVMNKVPFDKTTEDTDWSLEKALIEYAKENTAVKEALEKGWKPTLDDFFDELTCGDNDSSDITNLAHDWWEKAYPTDKDKWEEFTAEYIVQYSAEDYLEGN